MDDAGGMRGRQPLKDHTRQIERLFDGHSANRNDLAEGAAIDVLHHQEVAIPASSSFFHLHDVRMVKKRRRLSFLEVAPSLFRRQELRKDFDRYLSPGVRVARQIDRSTTALTAGRQYLESIDMLAGPQTCRNKRAR